MIENRLIAIGASAGGLEPIQKLLEGIPDDSKLSFVIIQHLSSKHSSMLPDILERSTRLKVERVDETKEIVPNCVYVIDPATHLFIAKGKIIPVKGLNEGKSVSNQIDFFLKSYANEFKDEGVAVILSGTGSDGTEGCSTLRRVGGKVLVQTPKEAKFDGMPNSIIAANVADHIGTVDELVSELLSESFHKKNILSSRDFAWLVDRIQQETGADFSSYNSRTLERRIEHRMTCVGIEELSDYMKFTRSNPRELEELRDSVLIKVTSFNRDPIAFEALDEHVLGLDREEESYGEYRVWVAGCCSGQEAYTLAFYMLDRIEAGTFPYQSFRIFATDLSEKYLTLGSSGIFSNEEIESLRPQWIKKYFNSYGDGYSVKSSVRNRITFSVHNLLADPPFSNLNLVTCRNVLIYFKQMIQKRVLRSFHYGLNVDGHLFLGTSESLGDLNLYFDIVDSKNRIFRKNDKDISVSTLVKDHIPTNIASQKIKIREPISSYSVDDTIMLRVVEELATKMKVRGLVLDRNHFIQSAFGNVRQFLNLKPGRTRMTVESLFDPTVAHVIGKLVLDADKTGKTVQADNIEFVLEGQPVD
ncbi:hypothetical protein N9D31_03865, partial [Oligoflexaceae bacterium]|nr:hypothetical protein [Oligoflexaceae bacterium]